MNFCDVSPPDRALGGNTGPLFPLSGISLAFSACPAPFMSPHPKALFLPERLIQATVGECATNQEGAPNPFICGWKEPGEEDIGLFTKSAFSAQVFLI